MIISRTPLRISFVGGGTDIDSYYLRNPGSVVSTAIDKYMYITVNDYFEKDKIITKYSKTEIVDSLDKLEHSLVRESLRMIGIDSGIEITSMSDIVGATGLGSSSTFTVGLLNALHSYLGRQASPRRLAEEACRVEIEMARQPIGRQDQYIAAYGGFRHIQFSQEGVDISHIITSKSLRQELQNNLLMFYTGMKRSASEILKEQRGNTPKRMEILDSMRDASFLLKESLEKGDLTSFGELLHRNWELKKKLAGGISNPSIDSWYRNAREAGASGGKISGAGGGGFLIFYCEKDRQDAVCSALKDLRRIDFGFEPHGSRIVFIGD